MSRQRPKPIDLGRYAGRERLLRRAWAATLDDVDLRWLLALAAQCPTSHLQHDERQEAQRVLRRAQDALREGVRKGSEGARSRHEISDDEPVLTLGQAAEVLGISPERVGQLCTKGALRSRRDGRRRYVAASDVEERRDQSDKTTDPPA